MAPPERSKFTWGASFRNLIRSIHSNCPSLDSDEKGLPKPLAAITRSAWVTPLRVWPEPGTFSKASFSKELRAMRYTPVLVGSTNLNSTSECTGRLQYNHLPKG